MAEKKGKEVEMTQIETEKLEEMKAEKEAMRLTLRNLEYEFEQKSKELDETKDTLGEMVRRLSETRDLLHSSLVLQNRYKDIATACSESVKEFLFKWLTKRNQAALTKTLQFYADDAQMKLVLGVLNYVLFGKEFKTQNEVEKTHFKLICERIDEDAISLPVHSLMVRLIVKYKLFQKIKDQIKD